jgi:hypothetical protein
MAGGGPDGEGDGVMGGDLVAVAEEVGHRLRIGHGQQAAGLADAVADLAGRDVLKDLVDEGPGGSGPLAASAAAVER